jgi:hypothetical protein
MAAFGLDKRPGFCYYFVAFVALDIPFDSFNKAAGDNLAAFCLAGWGQRPASSAVTRSTK